uniref:Uncharacterized protein n=1 Tax=Myoviridae sp. ctgyr15 TaxID=2827291 RepID=A0A8S5R4P6_9CAUD|nr:MAG TPA: hypothetical protein [Myoviridae sp. ctgyr15]
MEDRSCWSEYPIKVPALIILTISSAKFPR